ncbi:MAG: uncharacterized protein A8A55_3122, partial [Amphiamblys sp. WSBS2006]
MRSETTTLEHRSMFFVFTDLSVFLFPEDEYNNFQNDKEGYMCLKKKCLSEITNKDTERIICIVCHEEAELEDFVSPLCREMHFVICRGCMEYLKKRKDKREVVCPYCREKKSDKAYQEEILGILFSRILHKTLHNIELRPDTEVKTVTKLTRETKVVLSNIAITASLFFKLLSKTAVETTNGVSLVGHDNSLGRCIGELDWRTNETARLCFDECTNEEMEQVCSNIKTMPRKGIHINAKEIHAKENGVYILLKTWGLFDGYSPDLFLRTSKKEHIEEFLEEENSSLWIGSVKGLDLRGYAVELFPKLR